MGEDHIRGPTRTLLGCASNDSLCIVRTYQDEVIVVPVFLIGLTVILLAVILWMRYRTVKTSEHKQDGRSQISQNGLNSGVSLEELSLEAVQRTTDASLQALETPWDRVRKPLQLLGEGQFGPIYKTVLNVPGGGQERDIVIKQLRDSAGPSSTRDFLQRSAFQAWLGRHPHFVELVGCCTVEKPFCMLLENIEPGCLLNFLWDCRRDVLSMDGILYDITECQVYIIALQILSALEFLHKRNLLHGDVAARNVLIHRNFTAKLAGLGSACTMQLSGSFPSRSPAPLKWMAPERLLQLPLSGKSDVWSFGIFLYEMISLGAPPYPEVPPSSILQHLQRGNIMQRPSTCKPSMYTIMKSCWSWRHSERISLSELQTRLEVGKRNSNDKTVLQVPELVVPELYAGVAGTEPLKMEADYTVL
ncbi:tyrosine-protein kinase STYK1 isoform X2 [Spea bombifrons]|uniref:tyrosine-protein kinase STYK1 isoform X2 n=1 Tax=Spea bombifrons TaxID=233779 RepID=UPI00234B4D70|nr:tyrosine-protein kinase STYK1 isoform X2 [Spea bombifrons]